MVAALKPTATTLTYYPLGAAREFIRSRDPEVVIVGPAGTGKTYAAMQKLHLSARKYPGCRILLARKTLESLKTGALNTYLKHIQPRLDGVQEFGGNKFYPAEFRYPNGSVIVVGGLDKADKVMSAEFDLIFVNEATEVTEDDWQALKTRLRNGVMPYQQLLGDCNPSGARHWLKQRIDAGVTRGFTSTHQDNPAYWNQRRGEWTDMGRRYVAENLASLTGARRKRLLDGVWASAEGIIHEQFHPGMIKTVDTSGWRSIIGGDVGSQNPTAILTCHLAGDGRWHLGREFYRRQQTSSDIITAFRDRADECGAVKLWLDPSAKAYIDDLKAKRYPAEGAINDVLTGIQRVQAVMDQPGRFTIDPSCVNTIEEFGMYVWDDGGRAKDRPVKEDDHAMDALRYAVMGETTPRKSRGFITT